MKKYTYILILVFLFVIMPIFKDFSGFEAAAKNSTSMWNIEYPENIPEDVHIQIEPGFVYAGGLSAKRFKTPNSFKISAYRDKDTSYAFVLNDATISIDDKTYRLIEPSSYYYIYNDENIAQTTIFKGSNNVFPFYIAPVENLRYNKMLNQYSEAAKSFLIGAYVYPVKFNYKESVLKDKAGCIINIPLYNQDTFKTEKLVFKITF